MTETEADTGGASPRLEYPVRDDLPRPDHWRWAGQPAFDQLRAQLQRPQARVDRVETDVMSATSCHSGDKERKVSR